MVKRGTKRKIDIEKITDKNSRATSFTKRSHGLYSKASQLCLLTDAQIAVLATPSSSNSNVSFFSFGHSSVEAVVSAYLSGERLAPVSVMDSKEMREDLGVCYESSSLGLGHWWDDEERFKNPQDIMEGIKSIERLLSRSKRLRTNVFYQTLTIDDDDDDDFVPAKRLRTKATVNVIGQTLTITDDGLVPASSSNDDTAEREQILSISDNFCNNKDVSAPVAGNLDEWSDMDLDQLLNDVGDKLPENQATEEEAHHLISENLCSNNNNNTLLPENQTQEEDDPHQIAAVSDNLCRDNNNGLGNMDDEQKLLDLDFKTIFEGLSDQDHDEWTDMDLDQLLTDLDDENQTQEDKEDHPLSKNICNNNHNALLTEHQPQEEEEDHHQIVAVSENSCNNHNALLPAGNMDNELLDPAINLDFETIFKGMSDKELDEFAATFM